MQASSLRKYVEAFDLDIPPTAGKEQLILAVSRHWNQQVLPNSVPPVACALVTLQLLSYRLERLQC